MTKEEFMQKAIDLASENVKSGNGGPFGAIIVKNGEIIATGVNNVTTYNDPTAHAEVTAIRNACKELNTFQLDDCEIYSSCEPCPMCLGAIYWARPKALYFAADKDDAAEVGFDDSFLDYNSRSIATEIIKMETKTQPFIDWKNSEFSVEY
ncbi:MAG: tRNA-specific adenosine deaminase [Bacteroidetes bacterium 4572_112]|nr:MAG: tRNA-specific adenosine deaminase [Bacteroidetes bacterium 4572_112]